ncbi:hypothetical protein [Roseibium sp.]|uniref:hypothetical protein n=1 Tax=Roseibium sp. TaxID=1936156 RepID=UPI003D10CF74
MNARDLETVYETLAEQLDAVAAGKRDLFLAKLVLLLAHDLGDAKRIQTRIAEAADHLDV